MKGAGKIPSSRLFLGKLIEIEKEEKTLFEEAKKQRKTKARKEAAMEKFWRRELRLMETPNRMTMMMEIIYQLSVVLILVNK